MIQRITHSWTFAIEIREPTRVTGKTMTLLDVILASHPERYATCGNLHMGLSDHDLV